MILLTPEGVDLIIFHRPFSRPLERDAGETKNGRLARLLKNKFVRLDGSKIEKCLGTVQVLWPVERDESRRVINESTLDVWFKSFVSSLSNVLLVVVVVKQKASPKDTCGKRGLATAAAATATAFPQVLLTVERQFLPCFSVGSYLKAESRLLLWPAFFFLFLLKTLHHDDDKQVHNGTFYAAVERDLPIYDSISLRFRRKKRRKH